MPSATRSSHCPVGTTAFRNRAPAESFTRAQWRSRSGTTPSKARAPSNTEEPSQAAWVRAPISGTLPSCQSPAKKVQVFDGAAARVIFSARQRRQNARPAAGAFVERREVVLLVGRMDAVVIEIGR